MNITLRRRAKVLSTDFWEEQFRLLNERSIVHAHVPDGATKIKPYTFQGCSILQDVMMPNTITSIQGYAFSGCTRLEKINIPSSCTSIASYAFTNCDSLANIEFPSSVRTIADRVFLKNSTIGGLVNIKFNEGLVSIGDFCFQRNTILKDIVFPDSMTSYGNGLFNQCYGLKNVTLGSGIIALGNIFNGCPTLTSLTIRKKTPPTAAANSFPTWPTHIYVPYSEDHSVLNAYKTASGWSTYADRIEEIPPTFVEYIEATGTQVLDTGIAANAAYGFKFTMKGVTWEAEKNYIGNTNTGFVIKSVGSQGGLNMYLHGTQGIGWSFNFANESTWQTNAEHTSCTGPSQNRTYTAPIGTNSMTIKLEAGAKIRIKELRFFDTNNDLIYDGVPAYYEEGVGGMYDRVSKLFIGSSSADPYLCGPDVTT